MNLNLRIHHIGYAVKDIDKAIVKFASLGYSIFDKQEDTSRNVTIAFVEKDGYCVELISSLFLDTPSPVDSILKKNGSTPYHICYEVDDIQEACAILKKEQYLVISEISPAPAINGRKVVFLHNAAVGIIELVESTAS